MWLGVFTIEQKCFTDLCSVCALLFLYFLFSRTHYRLKDKRKKKRKMKNKKKSKKRRHEMKNKKRRVKMRTEIRKWRMEGIQRLHLQNRERIWGMKWRMRIVKCELHEDSKKASQIIRAVSAIFVRSDKAGNTLEALRSSCLNGFVEESQCTKSLHRLPLSWIFPHWLVDLSVFYPPRQSWNCSTAFPAKNKEKKKTEKRQKRRWRMLRRKGEARTRRRERN